MYTRLTHSLTAVALLTFCAWFASVSPAAADIIKIDITGNYTTLFLGNGSTVYGVNQAPPIAFDYSLTYDTTLGGAPIFKAAGTPLGGSTLSNDLYGYSAAGIIATSVTFGTETFTASMLSPRSVAGSSAAFWTDAALTATPTFFFADFLDPSHDADLRIGRLVNASPQLVRDIRLINNLTNGEADAPAFTVTTTNLSTVVPEPTTVVLLATGLLGLIARRRTA